MIPDKSVPLNDFLDLYSINWIEVNERIQSNARQVNKLTLFYAVMVGSKNELGQLDFPGSDDSNQPPLEILQDIIKFSTGSVEVSNYNTILIYALLNNNYN